MTDGIGNYRWRQRQLDKMAGSVLTEAANLACLCRERDWQAAEKSCSELLDRIRLQLLEERE